eukprot:scaffold3340_cov255-Pinguiococcus_pyrenoidosus.AAC.15
MSRPIPRSESDPNPGGGVRDTGALLRPASGLSTGNPRSRPRSFKDGSARADVVDGISAWVARRARHALGVQWHGRRRELSAVEVRARDGGGLGRGLRRATGLIRGRLVRGVAVRLMTATAVLPPAAAADCRTRATASRPLALLFVPLSRVRISSRSGSRSRRLAGLPDVVAVAVVRHLLRHTRHQHIWLPGLQSRAGAAAAVAALEARAYLVQGHEHDGGRDGIVIGDRASRGPGPSGVRLGLTSMTARRAPRHRAWLASSSSAVPPLRKPKADHQRPRQ